MNDLSIKTKFKSAQNIVMVDENGKETPFNRKEVIVDKNGKETPLPPKTITLKK